MGRSGIWKTDSYTEQQIGRIIRASGVSVGQETVHDYVAFCPFHSNNGTPSMSISKTNGTYICFNPACNAQGSLSELVKHCNRLNDLEAMRFCLKYADDDLDSFEKTMESLLIDKDEFVIFDPVVIANMKENLWCSREALDYMHQRGFDDDTLKHFNIGWSKAKKMIAVPAYSHTRVPVGVIGRSITEKRFKNSVNMPSSKIFFNLNNAMAWSTAIIVESAFDAMRVHQAGFPNVIANLGGHISPYKKELLNKYFDKVIIMTDNDKVQYNTTCRPCGGICRGHNPGRELGRSIADSFSREVLWAMDTYDSIYPHGAKDAGEMTDDEIRHVINNSVSDFEYTLTDIAQ